MIKNVRYLFGIMLCIANMIIYGLKVNISTTVTVMVRDANSTETSGEFGPTYEWTPEQQGLIVSLYFAGYLIGMAPSGYFADRFNTKWVLLFCVFCNSLLTLLVPLACPTFSILLCLRFFTGLVSAANLPIVNVLVGKWVVYEEKSMWVGIIYAGTSLGTVISILSSGWITELLGWPMVYYIHGTLPLIWCALFALFFADCPEDQKIITEEERSLLVNSYGHRKPGSNKGEVPWKAIFTSCPFLALIFTNTFGNFCWYLLLTQMPTYMSHMLKYKIKENATITCLPYLVNAFTNSIIGKFLDSGRKRGWWSQTGARKIAVGISCLPVCVFLIAITHVEDNRNAAVPLLCISIITSGAIFVGHLTNQNDLAPNFAGILMGITNTPGTISAFFLPWLVGKLNQDGHSFAAWNTVFWINIGAQLAAFVVFTIFGSGQIQPWNYPGGVVPS